MKKVVLSFVPEMHYMNTKYDALGIAAMIYSLESRTGPQVFNPLMI